MFFFSYVQLHAEPGEDSYADRLNQVNSEKTLYCHYKNLFISQISHIGQLLQNFLTALDLSKITPQRFLLQTGLKTYGVHLGPVSVPFRESDQRVSIQTNFYHSQEDLLFQYCKNHKIQHNITYPSWILGPVKASLMNIFYPLAVYASVQSYLGRPLTFPGDIVSWHNPQPISSGRLNSYFYEWAALSPNTVNQALNIYDNSEFTWEKFWPIFASWYGLEWSPPSQDAAYTDVKMPLIPLGYVLL